ncbi:aldo/keto reductase [Companilactobacillus kimchiensis]|uniref:aldo/keto reductase n=1 Tax=Companilactobacillus kimchiensis TaxID=993692 RepID=UPI0012EE8933|nr:aldo/keto reductase [Companilactobacillus kimchiensis]
MPLIKLNNGIEMPQEGLGVLNAGKFEDVKMAVLDGLDIGYRMIDTAQIYFNEEAVGAAIKESSVDRKDIFLTTKVWIANYGYENTKKSIQTSLEKLQTNYLDLVLIHQPYGDYYGAYRALEDLYDEGKIRAIGVANFMPDRYVDLVRFSRIVPAINQSETHVFYQQNELKKYLKKFGTHLESWGPFAEGRNNFFTNETLKKIGAKYDKTGPQVALKFLTQNGIIIIPKSVHKERMQQNLDIWNFKLSNEDMDAISQLDTGKTLFFSPHDPSTVERFAKLTKEMKQK